LPRTDRVCHCHHGKRPNRVAPCERLEEAHIFVANDSCSRTYLCCFQKEGICTVDTEYYTILRSCCPSKVSNRKQSRLIELLVNKLNQPIHMQFQYSLHHFHRLHTIIPSISTVKPGPYCNCSKSSSLISSLPL